jgi:Rieske Fe-S protein
MLLVFRQELEFADFERIRDLVAGIPHEVRWARRGGRLVLLVGRARPSQEDLVPLVDDPAVEYVLRDPSEREISRLFSRRDVLDAALAGTGLLAAAAILAPLGIYLASPASDVSPSGDLLVGRLDDIPVKGTATRVIDGEEYIIVRPDESHLYALSSTCTHSDVCHVKWDPDREELICPCHRGAFDLYGNVLSGPPPRPLATREVIVEAGDVFVKRGAR